MTTGEQKRAPAVPRPVNQVSPGTLDFWSPGSAPGVSMKAPLEWAAVLAAVSRQLAELGQLSNLGQVNFKLQETVFSLPNFV